MRISQMDLAGPLSGAEYFTLVQDGKTKKVQASSFSQVITSSCQCTLVSRFNSVGTDANTLEKFLQTYQMPAGLLRTNGSWLEIIAWGVFSNNTQKTIYLNFGSTKVSSGTGTINNMNWSMNSIIGRASGTSQKIKMSIHAEAISGDWQNPFSTEENANSSEDLNVSIPISLSAQNGTANANDIVCEGFIIRLNEIDVNS